VYDSYADPNDWGGGGTVSSGGGLARIVANTLQLDGQLLADGVSSRGGSGAGGGIYVSVTTLTGSGRMSAAGGEDSAAGNGGGGRIAVYAQQAGGFDFGRVSAPGGPSWMFHGGAGTIYIRNPSEAQGTLVIDNGTSPTNNGVTPLGLPGQTTLMISDAVIIRGDGTLVTVTNSVTFWATVTFAGGPLTGTGELRIGASGVLRVSGPAARFLNTRSFVNAGSLEVLSGSLTINSMVPQITGNTLTGGTWTVFDNASLSISSAGPILGNQASITLSGLHSSFTNLTGLTDNSGTLKLLNGQVFSTAADFRNAGIVTIGTSSALNVRGNYTQTPSATLNVEIGGTPESDRFSHFSSTRLATLAGTLNVNLVNNYVPGSGQRYPIMSFDRHAGNFAAINGLRLGRTQVFTAELAESGFYLSTLVAAADLVADSVTAPTEAICGQNVTIDYSVFNDSMTDATGSWVDSIYLSTTQNLTPSARLIGRVTHVGGVLALHSYSERLVATLPGAIEGNYRVILVADSQGRVPDANRDNNTKSAPGVIHVTMPVLHLGESTSGTIANNQDIYFRLDVPPGSTDVRLSANFTGTPRPEFYVRYGNSPDPAHYDQVSANLSDLHPQVLLAGRAGPYYVLLHGREGAGNGQPFDLTPIALIMALNGVSPNHGSSAGQTTVTVVGARFSPSSVVSLVAGNTERQASRVLFKDSNTLFATFNLSGLASGAYDVRVVDHNQSATLPGAFTVGTGAPGSLQLHISSPGPIRAGTQGRVTIDYFNAGETDIPAPLLNVQAQNALLRLAVQGPFIGNSVQVFGINSAGPSGILPPGAHGLITMDFGPDPSVPSPAECIFGVGVPVQSDPPMNWSAQKDILRPPTVPADAWDVIFANFLAMVGTTVGQYQSVLDDNETYLSVLGISTVDASRVYAFVLDQADDGLPRPTLDSAVDATAPQPGLPLTFSRVYHATLSGRYRLGSLGRGWTTQWDSAATADQNGNVTIRTGGDFRFFSRLANGTYQGRPGDHATLTLQGGSYRLRETDGTISVYQTDGKLSYVQDTNNNRITLGYTNGLLTTLTHSSGARFTLHYNGLGRIDQLTDEAGRITTYAYDPSGEHLRSVTGPGGTTSYDYWTGVGATREHALRSITNPDHTHHYFDYDDRGRLQHESRDGGAEPLTYDYNLPGGFTVTDGGQNSTTFLLDDMGQLRQVRDPLGRVVLYGYDADGNLVQTTAPGNIVSTYRYDSQGNLLSQVDPLGHEIAMTYEPTFNQLTSLTDARGNTTRYDYDVQGNLRSITYPNNSVERFDFDPLGNLTDSVNRRGHAINYTYDDQGRGLVKRKDYADGTHVDFTYDDRGNLRTATDASGTTTLDWDPVADRLNKITYPGGRFLQFFYDRGGDLRTRMVDQSGFTVVYSYYDDGSLKELRDGQNNLIVHYDYYLDGRLRRKDLGNGTYTTYEYDPAGELLHLVNYAPGGAVNSRFDYTYDDLGRRTSMTTLDGRWDYAYDLTGQLTRVSTTGRTIEYVYDAAGNRVSVTDNGVRTDYTTNELNQYITIGSATLAYDADGNLISKRDGNQFSTYTYNDDNLMTGAVTPDGTWTYQYDPFGNRKATVHNAQRTEYLLDPIGWVNVVGEYSGSGNLIARYTYGIGLASRIDPAGVTAYYDFDAIGSTVGISNGAGNYVNRYSYLPFGERLTSIEGIVNPFGYVGQWGRDARGQRPGVHASAILYRTDRPVRASGSAWNCWRN
jgi:YD repeat-containing protein